MESGAGKAVEGRPALCVNHVAWAPAMRSLAVALWSRKSKPESTAIAGNPFVSQRFRALVPDMEREFSAGWKGLEKAKMPTCRDIERWS